MMDKVKYSELQIAAQQMAPDIPDVDQFGLMYGFGQNGIPLLPFAHEWGGSKPIPPAIIQLLRRCEVGKPLVITYAQREYLVVLLEFTQDSELPEREETMESGKIHFAYVKLIPASLIDFDFDA